VEVGNDPDTRLGELGLIMSADVPPKNGRRRFLIMYDAHPGFLFEGDFELLSSASDAKLAQCNVI